MNDKTIFDEDKTSRYKIFLKDLFKDMLKNMSIPEIEEFAKEQLHSFKNEEIGKLIHKYGEIEVLGIILLNLQKIPKASSDKSYIDNAIKLVNDAIDNLNKLQDSWETL